MRCSPRISVALAITGTLLVSACGTEPTAESPTPINASVSGATFSLQPSVVSWSKTSSAPVPTTTQSVVIAGTIAATSYPVFGQTQWLGGASGWVTRSAPVFSKSPLGWRVTFQLNAGVVSTLPIGSYSAQIPVSVPGASNNPQVITVQLAVLDNIPISGTLVPGVQLPVVLTSNSPRFGGSTDPNLNPNGSKYALAFRLVLQAGQSVWVRHTGNYDPYLYVWREPASVANYIGSWDDACGLDSSFFIANNTGSTQSYLIYGSHFSTLRTGSGQIFLAQSQCGAPLLSGLQAESSKDPTLEAAMRAAYNAKYGITE